VTAARACALLLLPVALAACTRHARSTATATATGAAPSARLYAEDPGTVFPLPHPAEAPPEDDTSAAGPPRAPEEGGPFYEPDPEGRPTAILRADAPNMRYASLDGPSCEAELRLRSVSFARGEPVPGVLEPERIRGPMHGVSITTGAPRAVQERAQSEIFDCRLLLALDDFAALAAGRGIVEMTHMSAYRPRSAHGCTAKYMGLQHCAALAVDIVRMKLGDGHVWNVQRDFHGRVGIPTCGPTAQQPAPTPTSAGLWSLVCDAADRAIFNVMLTPNYNREHFNHLHVEITPDAEWMLIH
jgi:hypothetical protein